MKRKDTNQEKKKRNSDNKFKRFLRRFIVYSLCAVVLLLVGSHFLYLIMPDTTFLSKP